MFWANRGSGPSMHGLSCTKRGLATIHSLRKTMDCTSSRWGTKAQAHRREVRVQQKFCLHFVCLWTLRTLSWLNGVDYTLSRPIGYGGPLTLADCRLATNKGCFSDLNWKTSYCSELSDWPFELSRVLTITVGWVASLAHITNSYRGVKMWSRCTRILSWLCFLYIFLIITSAYILGVTVRRVAQRRDQLSPSHWWLL